MNVQRNGQLRMWIVTVAMAAAAVVAIAIAETQAAIIYDVSGETVPTLTDTGHRDFSGTMELSGGSTLVKLDYELDGVPQTPLEFSLGANLLALPPLPQDIRQWFDFDDRALLQSVDYETGAGSVFSDDIFMPDTLAGWDLLTLSTFDVGGVPFTASLSAVGPPIPVNEPQAGVLALIGLVGVAASRKFMRRSDMKVTQPGMLFRAS